MNKPLTIHIMPMPDLKHKHSYELVVNAVNKSKVAASHSQKTIAIN